MKNKVDPYVDFIIVINSSKSKKAEFEYLNSIIEIKNKFINNLISEFCLC